MYRIPLSTVIFVPVASNSPSLAATSRLKLSVVKPSPTSATTTTSPSPTKPNRKSTRNSFNSCHSWSKNPSVSSVKSVVEKIIVVFVLFRQCSSVFVLSCQCPFQMLYLCIVFERPKLRVRVLTIFPTCTSKISYVYQHLGPQRQ